MGTCLICGTSVDGHVCASHEQDVFFTFRGNHSDQLTPDRFYRGEVDGVADFGVFVNLSDRVTGLLHQSELPRRLESYDWTAGDELFVLVKEIRDNGDVDLGWSIRQSAREFRGRLIHTPSGDELPDEAAEAAIGATPEATREGESEPGAYADSEAVTDSEPESEPEPTREADHEPEPESEPDRDDSGESQSEPEPDTTIDEDRAARGERAEPDRVGLGTLEDHIGDRVKVEGRVATIRQTGGPTVFRVRDESGAADCAAFEAPGVRAYADVEEGDAVRIQGVVERHNDSLQVETDALSVLAAEEASAIDDRMESALDDRARPETVDTLADFPPVSALESDIGEAATVIRRAVFDARPVIIRHAATADGYLAGAAIERAILSLVRNEHEQRDAVYHYVDRRPFEGPDYDMNDATRDVTDMLDRRERHGEKLPLFLFVGAGGTEASSDGLGLLEIYEADRVIVDAEPADDAARRAVSASVTPTEAPAERVTTTTIAAAVGATVEAAIAEDLHHLPATSYWRDPPSVYTDLAAAAGYESTDLTLVRKAVALEAFYQAFEDKRELINDLLFGDPALAEPASEQFDDRLAGEVETAEAHLEERTVGDRTVAVLDVAAFTHRYDFPPTALLLDHLFERVDADALVGVGEDDLRVRANPPVDVRAVAERVREVVEEAGIGAEGGRSGRITFLVGERDVVLDAAIGAVANLAVA